MSATSVDAAIEAITVHAEQLSTVVADSTLVAVVENASSGLANSATTIAATTESAPSPGLIANSPSIQHSTPLMAENHPPPPRSQLSALLVPLQSRGLRGNLALFCIVIRIAKPV